MAYQTSARAAVAQSRWAQMHQLSVETFMETRPNGSVNAFFTLVAGPGTHWFKYGGAWMQVCTSTLSFPVYEKVTLGRLNGIETTVR